MKNTAPTTSLPFTVRRLRAALFCFTLLTAALTACAQSGTWTADANGAWSDTTKWASGTVADGTDSLADFSTVDITGTRFVTNDTARTIGNLKFGDATTVNNGWYLQTNSGNATLTLAVTTGTPTITVVNSSATNRVILAGTQGLVKDGAGNLNFIGATANAYSGLTTVNAGTLLLNKSTGVNAIPGDLTINAGATNQILAANDQIADSSTVTVNGGVLDITGRNETVGNVILDNNGAIFCSGSSQILTATNFDMRSGTNQPILAGASASLTKTGPGTARLGSPAGGGGANTYGGNTVVYAGVLELAKSDNTAAVPGNLTIYTNGTVSLPKNNQIADAATVTISGGTLDLALHNETIANVILDSGFIINSLSTSKTLTVNNSMDMRSGTVGAILGGAIALTKSTGGLLVVTGACAYTGATLIQEGAIQVGGGNDRLPAAGAITLGNGTASGKLIIGNASGPAAQTTTALTTSGSGTANAAVGGGSSINSQLILNYATDATFGVALLGGGGANENNLGLTKSGAGVLTVTGTAAYLGNTTNVTGTLKVGNIGAIASGTGKGNVAVTSGTLDLNGISFTINGLFGGGTVNSGVAGPVTLNLGNNDATASFAGVIADGAGTVSLSKSGSGNQTLTAINSYSGTTTIIQGLLSIDGDATLGNGAGTLELELGGTLNITASRSVTANPVANPIHLSLTGGAITTTSTAATVDVNFTSDTFGGSASTLTLRNDGGAGAGQFEPRFSGSFTFGLPIVIDNGANGTTRLSSFNTNGTTQTFSGVISGNGGFRRSFGTGTGGVTVFSADNTYTGATAVNNGTLFVNGSIGTGAVTVSSPGVLGGTGTINGPVTVSSGTLSPGASIGTLAISNSLTFTGGTCAIEINKTTATNDLVRGLTTVTYGGTLNVSLLSGSFAANDSFKIFDATSYSGSFTNFVPATPGAGLVWDTSSLANNGTLKVASAPVGGPSIGSVSVAGGSIILAGSGGEPNHSYNVLTSADLSLPKSNWGVLSSSLFDGSGNFNATNAVNPAVPYLFYAIQFQLP